VAVQFLFWEYLFGIFGIGSLQSSTLIAYVLTKSSQILISVQQAHTVRYSLFGEYVDLDRAEHASLELWPLRGRHPPHCERDQRPRPPSHGGRQGGTEM
jgi:hypothetical protein